jgi:homoserine/homoserine lactone efflux protein
MDVGMLIGVCLVASLSPGPAVLSTVETSLRFGSRRAFWHTLGLAAGEVPQSLLALAIAIWMTNQFGYARAAIAASGAAWFFWMGVSAWVRPREALPEGASLEGAPGRLFWRGFWVNLSNPKTVPWILVIIQAGRLPTESLHLSAVVALLLVTIGSETSVMSLYAFLAERLRPHLRTPAVVRAVDRVIGTLWLLLGGLLLAQAWQLLSGR